MSFFFRFVMYFESDNGQIYAYIPIGATCVGSINICYDEGAHCASDPKFLDGRSFNKGDDFGYFAVNIKRIRFLYFGEGENALFSCLQFKRARVRNYFRKFF